MALVLHDVKRGAAAQQVIRTRSCYDRRASTLGGGGKKHKKTVACPCADQKRRPSRKTGKRGGQNSVTNECAYLVSCQLWPRAPAWSWLGAAWSTANGADPVNGADDRGCRSRPHRGRLQGHCKVESALISMMLFATCLMTRAQPDISIERNHRTFLLTCNNKNGGGDFCSMICYNGFTIP